MAQVDGLLRIVKAQGGTTLELESGAEPRVLRGERKLRVFLPTTNEQMLRDLLGELVTEEREADLEQLKTVTFQYDAEGISPFDVTLTRTETVPLRAHFRLPRLERPGQGGKSGDAGGTTSDEPGSNEANSAPAAAVAAPAPTAVMPALVSASAVPAAEEPVVPPTGAALAELSDLFEQALELGASDIHLARGESAVVRVDGQLSEMETMPPYQVELLLGALVTPSIGRRLEAARSADFVIDIPRMGRFRTNVFRCESGEAAAIRILRRKAPSLSKLNLPVSLLDLLHLPHGVVLVVGPTGAGKSTTIAALTNAMLRTRGGLMVTLEDPIEHLISPPNPTARVRQRQVGLHTASFPQGLRDALREDPDYLLVGEMRDRDSIALALTAGETGALVFASLHSRSASSAIQRIVDTYPPERQNQIRVQLADSLRAVIAQKLLPARSGRGRVVAMEVLRVNSNVASLIREGKTAQIPGAIQSGLAEGMMPLEKCLAERVRDGLVSEDDARAVANNVDTFAQYLNNKPRRR